MAATSDPKYRRPSWMSWATTGLKAGGHRFASAVLRLITGSSRAAIASAEDILAATQPTADAHLVQGKAPIDEEGADGVGLGELIWISADPIDDVAPAAHSTVALVFRPRRHVVLRPARQHCAQEPFRFLRRAD